MCGCSSMCLYGNPAVCEMEFPMAAKQVSLEDEERTMVVAALDLAIGSCERRSNRTGEVSTIKDELVKQAERYRILKNKLVLTK